MLEPAHLLAFAERRIARERLRPGVIEIAEAVEELQLDAGDQDRRDRHQRDHLAPGKTHVQHRALVLAEQPLDALQRDRVHVPGVARDVSDALDPPVMRRVEAMIHAGGEPQRHKCAIAES